MQPAPRGRHPWVMARRADDLARDLLARATCVAAAGDERIYLAVVAGGVPARSIARAAGLSHTAVNKLLRRVENRRDHPEVDDRLSRLETEIAA